MQAEAVFTKDAQDYDQSRRGLIPCFEDFYGAAIQALPFDREDPVHFLDLGAGTGLLSEMVLESFPQSTVTLIDASDAMLGRARERLVNHDGRTRFVTADYRAFEADSPFDAIVSALSIHHFAGRAKARLFARAWNLLRPGGMFVNADQVCGADGETENAYRRHWFGSVRERVSGEELLRSLDRLQADRMSTLEEQLNWLREAGFDRVATWFQNFSFVVYSGRRP